MLKKFLFCVVLISATSFIDKALSEIIPPKKPLQTIEETEKKLLVDVLKPLPKPIEKIIVKQVEKKPIVKKKKKIGLI